VLDSALDVVLPNANETVLSGHGKGAKKQSVGDREDGGGSADSERENNDGRGGDARRGTERASRLA
jgi:hypothetical protein